MVGQQEGGEGWIMGGEFYTKKLSRSKSQDSAGQTASLSGKPQMFIVKLMNWEQKDRAREELVTPQLPYQPWFVYVIAVLPSDLPVNMDFCFNKKYIFKK